MLDPYGWAWLGMALGALLVISPVLAMTSPVVTAAWGWLVSAVRSLRTLGVDRDALVRELLGTIDD